MNIFKSKLNKRCIKYIYKALRFESEFITCWKIDWGTKFYLNLLIKNLQRFKSLFFNIYQIKFISNISQSMTGKFYILWKKKIFFAKISIYKIWFSSDMHGNAFSQS